MLEIEPTTSILFAHRGWYLMEMFYEFQYEYLEGNKKLITLVVLLSTLLYHFDRNLSTNFFFSHPQPLRDKDTQMTGELFLQHFRFVSFYLHDKFWFIFGVSIFIIREVRPLVAGIGGTTYGAAVAVNSVHIR